MDRIEGYGMSEMPGMHAPMQQGTPVSMNVSINASGKEHVDDLITMMKNAGMGAAEPASAPTLSPRMDMERLSGIMNGPDMGPEIDIDMESEMEEPCPVCDSAPCACDHTEEAADGGFGDATTELNPEYGDMSDAIPAGNDLHKQKKSFKVVAGGDNPMAYKATVEGIKTALLKALTEKKAVTNKKIDKVSKEGNAFGKAVRDAKANGDKTVKVGGKTMPVKEADKTMSRAAKGHEKYGKEGMAALAKAGKEGKNLDPIRKKYDKYDESAKPDFLDMDKDGNKKEPMKKAVADKKKGAAPKKGVNPFAKKTNEAHTGEKFDALKHVKNPTQGEKDAAKDVKRGSYSDRAAMLKSAEKDGRLKK